MRSNIFYQTAIAGFFILTSCQPNNSAKQDESQQIANEIVMNKVTDCKVSVANITFTNAINGADNCVNSLIMEYWSSIALKGWIFSVIRMESCLIRHSLSYLSLLKTRNLLH